MTEVKAEGNILKEKKYPEILDNTMNFVLPYHSETDKKIALKNMRMIFTRNDIESFTSFKLKHHFNGYFLVFQIKI